MAFARRLGTWAAFIGSAVAAGYIAAQLVSP